MGMVYVSNCNKSAYRGYEPNADTEMDLPRYNLSVIWILYGCFNFTKLIDFSFLKHAIIQLGKLSIS